MNNWQVWITQNYSQLSYWAKKWTPQWRDLLSFLAIYLEKNWSKFSQIPDDEQRIKFIQSWFKNNVNWKNSEFNNSLRVNNFDEIWIEDTEIESYIEVEAEDFPKAILDIIVDLHREFGEEGAVRIIAIKTMYKKLEMHEKALFDLYFTKMLSLRQIAKKLNLPMSAVYGMVTDLKNKIKVECRF